MRNPGARITARRRAQAPAIMLQTCDLCKSIVPASFFDTPPLFYSFSFLPHDTLLEVTVGVVDGITARTIE
jgi:hypothetical protein